MPPFSLFILPFGTFIQRLSDGAMIPVDPANHDYQDYLNWVSAGSPSVWPVGP